MTPTAINRLVHNLSQSLAAERLGDLPDAELLRRLSGGDAAAFEATVRRHGPAVLAAARAVLPDEADVEDVFQAAFLALWRSGRRIRKGTSLGPWLFGVARRASLKALARSKRRRLVEGAKPVRAEVDPADLSWREACRLLHEEIERLPQQYREPIVLCHLEGRSRDEAAAELGWKLATLRGRLERGRDMLKRRLTCRGVALSAGLLAWLAGQASDANELSAALVSAALRTPKEMPAAVVELLPSAASSAARRMALGVVALCAASVVAAGLAGGERRGLPPPPSPEKPAGTSPAARPVEAGDKIVVKGRVVDPVGKPVAGAKLEAYRWNVGGHVKTAADGDGRFALELPGGKPKIGDGAMRLVASAAGLAPAVIEVPAKPNDDITVTLPEGTPLEGRILTLEGQPVAGAEVRLKTFEVFAPGDLERHMKAMQDAGDRFPSPPKSVRYLHVYLERYSELLAELNTPVKTDRDGRFRIPNVGRDRLVDLALSGPTIQHVDLVARTQPGATIKIDHRDEYRRFVVLPTDFEHLARPARLLRGTVRDKSTGKPVTGVKVFAAGSTATAVTDAGGRYEIAGCPKGNTYTVTVVPPPEANLFVAERRVADGAGLAALTVDIDLLPGIRLSGRILDGKTGQPVPGAVEYNPLPGNAYLDPKRDATGTRHMTHRDRSGRRADSDTSYSVVVAPGPGLVMVRGDSQRYLDACLDPAEIFPELKVDRSQWGDKRVLNTQTEEQAYLMLTQSEYRIIEPINPTPAERTMRLDLRMTPTTTVNVRFLDPDAKPLASVWSFGLVIGRVETWSSRTAHTAETADVTAIGIHPKRPQTFYAYHAARNLAGEFTLTGTETQRVELSLKPAATLTGRLVGRDGKPLAGHIIHAYRVVRIDPTSQRHSSPHFAPENTVTDTDGRFSIPGLLPDHEHTLQASAPRTSSGVAVSGIIEPLRPGEKRDLGTLTLRRE